MLTMLFLNKKKILIIVIFNKIQEFLEVYIKKMILKII